MKQEGSQQVVFLAFPRMPCFFEVHSLWLFYTDYPTILLKNGKKHVEMSKIRCRKRLFVLLLLGP